MKSGGLYFPFQEDIQNGGLRRAYSVNDVLKSCIRCYLLTSPGQRRGNPIGSFLPELKHKLLPNASLQGISDELKKDLTTQFPGVTFINVALNKTFENNDSNLEVTIQFGSAISELDELKVLI